MTPSVSVVVPIYNQVEFVGEAISSVLSQSVANIEVIVINDGSTDGSGAVADSIKDPRLVVVHQANSGPSGAVNAGIRSAKGEYIALLGGDDVAEPNRLEEQLALAATRGVDLVFTLPSLIDGTGRMLEDRVFPAFRKPDVSTPQAMFRKLLIEGNFLCAPSAFMSRRIMEQVGEFRHDLLQLQDYDYWLRAAACKGRFAVMDARLTRYRRHGNNLSGQEDDAVTLAEWMVCIHSALTTAPADFLAETFPEVLPPGQSFLTNLDRGVIALLHPRMSSLASMMLIESFLCRRSDLIISEIPRSRLGLLTGYVQGDERATLGGDIPRPDNRMMNTALFHPCPRELEVFK